MRFVIAFCCFFTAKAQRTRSFAKKNKKNLANLGVLCALAVKKIFRFLNKISLLSEDHPSFFLSMVQAKM